MAKSMETLSAEFEVAVKVADKEYARWERAKRNGATEIRLARLYEGYEAAERRIGAIQAEMAKLEMSGKTCPCCGRDQTMAEVNARPEGIAGLGKCDHCGAVYGACYLGESYKIVLPQWHEGPDSPEDTFYYDIMALGSEGTKRRHGWAHKVTRRITQTG